MARPRLRISLLLTALALVAAPALAGCIGTASATSAKEHKSEADAAAKAWSPDASLAQIIGVEGTLGAAMGMLGVGTSGDFKAAGKDESIGDGKAEVWVYRYVAASKTESYVVVVDKEGNVVREGTEAKNADDKPLGAWELDSHEALQIALQANEGLRKGVEGTLFGVVTILHQESGSNAVWLVAGGGASNAGGGGGHVLVDALTGKVLSSEGGFGDAARTWMG